MDVGHQSPFHTGNPKAGPTSQCKSFFSLTLKGFFLTVQYECVNCIREVHLGENILIPSSYTLVFIRHNFTDMQNLLFATKYCITEICQTFWQNGYMLGTLIDRSKHCWVKLKRFLQCQSTSVAV